ncbi:MAG TPA: TauD/TfdA family dioxygenase [Stellaceae bacterium]|nr:TauD/TfdA family dioxygenase [Stellaceae bacterium]
MTAHLSLRRLGKRLGTEVLGADLARLDDATFAEIEEVFRDHPVLVFREQRLDAQQLAAFGARFGHLRPHILENYRHPDDPRVSFITNVAKDGGVDRFGVTRASSWHADETYDPPEALPRLAILHAVEVPREKGGTMFADMYAAYETLSPALQQRLAGMTGRHGYTDGPDARKIYTPEHIAARNAGRPEQLHPAVKPHPVTGRNVLFVNPTHCHGFVGMTNAESDPLIEELRDHSIGDDNIYYHQWRVGDVVIWDEIATMHRGAADAAPEERRVMLRTIVHPN